MRIAVGRAVSLCFALEVKFGRATGQGTGVERAVGIAGGRAIGQGIGVECAVRIAGGRATGQGDRSGTHSTCGTGQAKRKSG